MFSKNAYKYLLRIINQRIRLHDNHKSQNPTAIRSAEILKRNLTAYPHRTNSQMANWILNNLADIYNIIPGRLSPAHSGIKTKVTEIKNQAIVIQNGL